MDTTLKIHITCPTCKQHVYDHIGEIYNGGQIELKRFVPHGGKPKFPIDTGELICCYCKSDLMQNGRIHTDRGWKPDKELQKMPLQL